MCCALDDNGEDISSVEFLQYDFTTIEIATDFFSDTNKLGQGGFGAVYKVRKEFEWNMSLIIIGGNIIQFSSLLTAIL